MKTGEKNIIARGKRRKYKENDNSVWKRSCNTPFSHAYLKCHANQRLNM